MTRLKRHLLTTTSLLFLAAAIPAQATDGYFENAYGTRSKGLAGADVAFSQDSIAAALNPAGLAYVGDRLDVEGEFFSPLRQYSVNGEGNPGPGSFPLTPGTTQSHKNYYVIPTVGWSHKLDDKQTLGVVR